MEKSKIYNVIILDKSGSMTSIRKQAVDSVNETLGAIRSAANANTDAQHYVTIVAFCGCEIKKIVEDAPIASVNNVDYSQYQPCCTTPLYDAVGSTVSKLKARCSGEEKCVASVTIITDGYENSSREYKGSDVKSLIESCKELGWMFAYIGADHDVESVAFSMSIDNALRYEKSDDGMRNMSMAFCDSLVAWNDDACSIMAEEAPAETRLTKLKKASKSFFKK